MKMLTIIFFLYAFSPFYAQDNKGQKQASADIYLIDITRSGDAYNVQFSVQYTEEGTGKRQFFKTADLDDFTGAILADIQAMPDNKNNVLFYIHGMFGSTPSIFERTIGQLNALYSDPPRSDIGKILALRWPGNVWDYSKNKESAEHVAPLAAETLFEIARKIRAASVLNKSYAVTIDLMCHSLGNEVLNKALAHMNASAPLSVLFDQVLLLAPDLETDVFDPGNALHKLDAIAGRTTVYYTRNDVTLKISQDLNKSNRLGQFGIPVEKNILDHLYFVDTEVVNDEDNFYDKMSSHSYFRSSRRASYDILQVLTGTSHSSIDGRVMDRDSVKYFRLVEMASEF